VSVQEEISKEIAGKLRFKLNGEQQRRFTKRYTENSEAYQLYPYLVGTIYTGLGQKDAAFANLERAYEERDSWMDYLKLDRRLDPLRVDPRFADLLRRMNLSR